MSEQNILNPSVTSLFNPDFGYSEGLPEMRSIFQARSGNLFLRQQAGLGRSYALTWNGRDLATKLAFQQWESQYLNDFFSLADWESGRYFTGHFDGPLKYSPSGNHQWNVTGTFAELPGLPMFAYPTNWARDAMFLEESNSAGESLVKLLTPANWSTEVSVADHGGKMFFSAATNETAEWLYWGYGVRFWAPKRFNGGICELTYTRTRDGAIVAGPLNVDLYSAGGAAAAVLDTQANLALDFYRVKVRCTGTKNGSSSGFFVFADALEVMK